MAMGVQFIQADGLYSQLLQVGNLLHIGQHESCHKWKYGGNGGGGGGGGYFKHLLEGEDSLINPHHIYNAEDTKPIMMRAFEFDGATHCPINGSMNHATNLPPSEMLGPKSQECLPSPTKQSPNEISCVTVVKRARELSHIKGPDCKRERKTSGEEGEEKLKKGGAGGRRASVKTKAPKPSPPELPKTDYVHVRARRGQATDSHSLAERVRREKISERMRFLQDLVPGCSKITGKAMILDEIINYVQSLQNQVEFLAMRLASMNPRIDNIGLHNLADDEEIGSPFVEEVKECIDMLPKNLASQTSTSDIQFDSLPIFYSGLFDEANYSNSMMSDLSTTPRSTSSLTNMDVSNN